MPQAAISEPGGFSDEGDTGMSGWLVMWGPLIIVGFLILVFMGGERKPVSMSAAPAAPAPMPAPVLKEPRLDISPERAAADLAEAFKAAGIPLPGEVKLGAPKAAPAPDLPPELQANPWAPAPGQSAAVPPPPPAYHGQYPHGYGQPVAPPGYGYGAPPRGYGWGAPPPGYGAPYMGGRPGMGYGAPGYPMPHQGMSQQGMPQHGMQGYGAGQAPPPPPSQ